VPLPPLPRPLLPLPWLSSKRLLSSFPIISSFRVSCLDCRISFAFPKIGFHVSPCMKMSTNITKLLDLDYDCHRHRRGFCSQRWCRRLRHLPRSFCHYYLRVYDCYHCTRSIRFDPHRQHEHLYLHWYRIRHKDFHRRCCCYLGCLWFGRCRCWRFRLDLGHWYVIHSSILTPR
jgi:hypothetical protein